MKLSEYQKKAMYTAENRKDWRYAGLGVAGEAGELVEQIKKREYPDVHGWQFKTDANIAEELGDLMWYCAYVADCLGLSLDKIAERNLEKLRKRMSLIK